MSAKEITYSIIAVLLIAVIAFNSYKYWQKEDRIIELSAEDKRLMNEKDSLKKANADIQIDRDKLRNQRDSLLSASRNEFYNRQNIIANSKKRREQIFQNNTAVNRRFNDEYIINYKPEY